MTEGELKKRILAIVENQIGKTMVSTLLTKDVVDWIDEAKKELMPIIEEWYISLDSEFKGTSWWQDYEEDYAKFKKWFGDSS